MTLQRIAYLLCAGPPDQYAAEREILPNSVWCEETQGWVDEAFNEVERLKVQRDELSRLIPQSADKYALQFSDAALMVARDLTEKLEIKV